MRGFFGWTVVAAVAIVCCVRCGGEPAATPTGPRVPGAALEFGEVSIPFEELRVFDEYFEDLDPTIGKKWLARELLTQHCIPLAFARHDFASKRATDREAAQALADVAQNDIELRARLPDYGVEPPERPHDRSSLPLAIARFAFLDENLGRAFGPIETGRGFTVVSLRDIRRGNTRAADLADLVIVGFPTHDNEDAYRAWWRQTKVRARDTLTWVHPDLRRALPAWLTP